MVSNNLMVNLTYIYFDIIFTLNKYLINGRHHPVQKHTKSAYIGYTCTSVLVCHYRTAIHLRLDWWIHQMDDYPSCWGTICTLRSNVAWRGLLPARLTPYNRSWLCFQESIFGNWVRHRGRKYISMVRSFYWCNHHDAAGQVRLYRLCIEIKR